MVNCMLNESQQKVYNLTKFQNSYKHLTEANYYLNFCFYQAPPVQLASRFGYPITADREMMWGRVLEGGRTMKGRWQGTRYICVISEFQALASTHTQYCLKLYNQLFKSSKLNEHYYGHYHVCMLTNTWNSEVNSFGPYYTH